MTLPRSYVDGFLVDWDEGEYQAQVRSMRQRSEAIAPALAIPAAGSANRGSCDAGIAQRAQAVRARLSRTVRKVPEVMVKITSSCRGMKQIGRHIDYISRKGTIDLEDQDGMVLRGKEALKDLKADWRTSGPEEIADDGERRDTLNIVFSMPADTDEVSMKRAMRAFAAAAFADHPYVFAYHTQATDPDPDPPAHPHVHLTVKTQARSGRRLNPRKADLQRWREDFASQLRAHGIDANATSRLARLNRNRGAKRKVIAMTAKGEALRAIGHTGRDPAKLSRAQELEAKRLTYYQILGDVLLRSEDAEDRSLGRGIFDALGVPEKSFTKTRDMPERDRH